MDRPPPFASASGLIAAVLAATVLAACFGGSDDGAGEEAGSNATLSIPATFALRPIDATVPDETLAGEDGSSVAEVLADDTVTEDELVAAYETYVACLVEGGGSGRYAYAIELQSGLVVEWAEDGGSADVDRNVLSAGCSRRHLGDLTRLFGRANPPGDDLDGRRSASIAACIEPISPQAAANLPAEVTIGTTGETTTVGELQLDPAALDPESLGSSPEDTAAVSACIASLGAEWRSFG
jgi:hypothetical protein